MSALRAAVSAWMVAGLLGLAPAHASADEPHVTPRETHNALTGDVPVTLRPEPALREIARRAARVLATRTGVAVDVGDPPPAALITAVPMGHVAIAQSADVPGDITLVFAGKEATYFEAVVRFGSRRGLDEARTLAIAIESLREAALATPLPSVPTQAETAPAVLRTRHRVRLRSDGFSWSHRGSDRLPLAKPTIYLRGLLGLSTARSTFLIGPGTGLGLCISRHCVVIEGDLPLIPEERSNERYRVRYRFLNFSARFQFRPFQFGPFVPGISFGLVTRIGTASLVGTGRSQTVTDAGLRMTIEAALRIDRRFEVVVEGGLDFAISRAQFVNRAGDTLVLEDRWTPWLITGLRLRP